jgi:parallel beta-helix repeat protein
MWSNILGAWHTAPEYGVLAWDVEHGTIHSNEFHGAWGFLAVDIHGYQGLSVSHNTFGGYVYALMLSSGQDASVRGNSFDWTHQGVVAHSVQDLELMFNTFEYNDRGVTGWALGDTILRGNGFRSNHVAAELHFLPEAQAELRLNELTDGWFGLRLENAQKMTFTDNLVTGGLQGLEVRNTDHVVIDNNEFRENLRSIVLDQPGTASITGNEIRDSPLMALIINGPEDQPAASPPGDEGAPEVDPGVHIFDNLFLQNGLGVHVTGQGVVIEDNLFVSHHFSDIMLSNVPNGAVLDNQIVSPHTAQIRVDASRDILIAGNSLQSKNDLLELRATTGATLQGNTLSSGGYLIDGTSRAHFTHTVDETNTVGGKPLVYVLDEPGAVISGTPGQVILVSSHGATVQDADLQDVIVGAIIAHSDDVSVDGSSFSGIDLGVVARSSDRVHLMDNTFQGNEIDAVLLDTVDAQVTGNSFSGLFVGAIVLESHDASLHHNTVQNANYGLVAWDSTGTTITGNHVQGAMVGVALLEARDATITGNTITDSQDAGVLAEDSRDLDIEHNEITDNKAGIVLDGAMGATIRLNQLQGNDYAVIVTGQDGDGHAVHENNIHGNTAAGVLSTSAKTLAATGNWWGCSDGPGAPGCDEVEGQVDYIPWLTTPVTDAGLP